MQTWLIMDLCLEAAWIPEAQGSKKWWEQEGLYLEDIQDADRAMKAEKDLGLRAEEEEE